MQGAEIGVQAGVVGMALPITRDLMNEGVRVFMAENPYLNGEYVRLDGAIRMAPR